MISSFRDFAKSKWAMALLVVLALSLLITGGTQMDVFASLGPRHVISAGDRSVDQAQFRSDFDRVRGNIEEQQGRPVTAQELIDQNVHVRYLESQTQRLGFLAWAWKAGIRPGQDVIAKQIRQIPAFFSEVTGKFDEQRYAQALAQANLTPAQLEQEFRDEYMQRHYAAALFAGARTPRVYGALVATQALEQRDGRWFRVTQDMAGRAGAPTDAQLTAFLNENGDQLRRPEQRTLSVVVFGNAPGQPVEVTEAQVQERFEFRKDALSLPERRSFVVITAPNQQQAQSVAQALRGGQTPDAAAQAAGLQPTRYDETPRSAVPDPAVAGAAFGLPAAGVSAPVQARVGFAVVAVTGILPAEPATLEGVREAIVQELRGEAERKLVFDRVQRFETLRGQGRTLEQAAAEVGARILPVADVSREGRTAAGGQVNSPPAVLETAWSLQRGGVSDVVDAGNGQYFAVRVDAVKPAALPPLDEVRADLTRAWVQRENNRLLRAKADELAGRLRAGEDIVAVARSVGAELVVRTGVQQDEETQTALGAGVLSGLFGQGKGQAFAEVNSETDFVVGVTDAIRAPAVALVAPIAERVRPRIGQDLANGLGDLAIAAGQSRMKAEFDVGLAREALGLPREAPATTGPQ
ncbi:MAG TPA: peptidyl-prolyl cis-trans isomerase [Brevundimonas sp.]|jgi:peptidyl-prolyl cis-trans isomerase D|uniref:peptidylprolyl isomerase n=1 Tax=Brevundimonas sp. TaxID=1871086 RepID=UPI002DEB42BB|nr:peptidyl-prolyl cis-trans isomerase [Brevundimonas sp.]